MTTSLGYLAEAEYRKSGLELTTNDRGSLPRLLLVEM